MGMRTNKRTDKVNVVDIESTCWEGDPPRGQQSEIIQVGIAVIDVAKAEIESRDSIFVKPERSKVSAFCTKLTGISQEQADGGVSFAELAKKLEKEYDAKSRLFASFGDYDRNMFGRMATLNEVRYPFGGRHLNVKTLLAISLGWEHEVGMDEALNRLGLPLEGKHHDAGDDAANIAKLFLCLIRNARELKKDEA